MVARSKLPFQQPYMTHLKVLRVAHNPKQFQGFTSFLALSSQFRYPGLLRDQAYFPFSDKVFGASKHFFDHRGRMWAHVGYIT
jgi:hypothetical protein